MKKNTVAIICSTILIGVFFASSCLALEFGARANYWFPSFRGDLRVDKDSIPGTQMDLKEDLGVKNENIPFIEAYFGVGKHEITFMYAQVNFSGTKFVDKPIIFDGRLFNPNSLVESELNTKMLDLEYQYKIVNFKNILAGLTIGLIGKVKYFDGSARLRSTTTGSTYDNTQDIHAPIPMIGLGAKIGILANILEARAKITGMGYSGSFFYDAMGDVAITPFPFVDVHAGYRAMSLKIDNISDIYANMNFSGPYIGIAVGF
jgi:outer membrane protein